jgi:uncharacterized membrane protein
MSYNGVIDVVIAVHATTATVSLILGAYTLRRRPKGDRTHRRLGRVWVCCMYVAVLSSFAIKRLDPGHFSWIHLLSIFTFGTLSIGVWAAMTGRVQQHRRFMTGSYFGLVGAFIGAVAVPVRVIPQLAIHHWLVLVAAAAGCVILAVFAIVHAQRVPRRSTDATAVQSGFADQAAGRR